MKVQPTQIAGVLIVEPDVFGDDRGFFLESFNEREMRKIGIDAHFVQDNHSRSQRNVLRGLHYQIRQPQGKLVRVVSGTVFDVAVDIRRNSPTFGSGWAWSCRRKTSACSGCLREWPTDLLFCRIPRTFFTKRPTIMRRSLNAPSLWNDPDLGIEWPLAGEPILSAKDAAGLPFREAEVFEEDSLLKEANAKQ